MITNLFQGELNSIPGAQEGAKIMADGQALAVDNDCVGAIWGNGADPGFMARVIELKGRDERRPLGLTIGFADFMEWVDMDRIHPDVRKTIGDPYMLAHCLGALAFVRAPANAKAEDSLPPSVMSRDSAGNTLIQNYDPIGKLALRRMILYAHLLDVDFPAVTSLNESGRPEIFDPGEAARFAREKQIPLLRDSTARRAGTGSFPIVELGEQGVTALRIGNITDEILTDLLHEVPLQIPQNVRRAAGQPISHEDINAVGEKGSELREAILAARDWS